MTIDRIVRGLGYAAFARPVSDEDRELRIKNNDAGVLLIDMQDFFTKKIAKKRLERMIYCQTEVLDYCSDYDIPVFVLEYGGSRGKTIESLAEKIKLLKNKKPIKKNDNDGFCRTGLAKMLHNQDIKRIMLMGINASSCVQRTAEGALGNGIKIMTSRQLIANPPHWDSFEKSIKWYQKKGFYQDDYRNLLKLI